MNTNIIFFDIDGTILSHRNHTISDSTKAAIRKAQENGHLAFVNTGRSYAEINREIIELGFDGFVCGCGTYIRHGNEDLLHTPIPAELCQELVADLRKYPVDAVLEGTHTIYFNDESPFPILQQQKEIFRNQLKFNIKSWDDPQISFDKFSVWYENLDSFRGFLDKYQEMFDFMYHGNNFIEIIPKGYSKATGIEFLINHLELPHENTFALGDSINDLSMLTYVKNSIGMGNSHEDIIGIVSFLTKDVDEEGVAHALEYFKII